MLIKSSDTTIDSGLILKAIIVPLYLNQQLEYILNAVGFGDTKQETWYQYGLSTHQLGRTVLDDVALYGLILR